MDVDNPSTPASASPSNADSSTAGKNSKAPRKSSGPTPAANGSSKRRKVNHACLYCRRSHMHCDEARPCQRCIKRDIGHLCHDEVKQPQPKKDTPSNNPSSPDAPSTQPAVPAVASFPVAAPPAMVVENSDAFRSGSFPFSATSPWPLLPQTPLMFGQQDGAGNEFSVLSDFLESLDERSFFGQPPVTNPAASLINNASLLNQGAPNGANGMFSVDTSFAGAITRDQLSSAGVPSSAATLPTSLPSEVMQLHNLPQMTPTPEMNQQATTSPLTTHQTPGALSQKPSSEQQHELEHVDPMPPTTKTERFLLTAADQESGTRDERLAAVIHAKYEAGLLKPYNYVKGYARLSRWMERNCTPESRQQILQPISILRPKFRAIAQALTDIDLVFIEEAFERMLLDYDRVFSAMGIPACLWRRTGEIYKGNKEFADLIGIDVGKLREGRLCIYELMSEESTVNYWEKYGHVAFDPGQKAVLTSCVLRYKPALPALQNTSSTMNGSSANKLSSRRQKERERERESDEEDEEIFINCCFSFTIRRDTWGIPSMIVGNFIKC